MLPIMQPVLDDIVYLAQGVRDLPESFQSFVPDSAVQYYPLCDDFGPMNLECVVQFISQLDECLAENPTSRIFYLVEDGKRQLTNAVFLLGSYMILKREMPVSDVVEIFSWTEDEDVTEEFRDATFSDATFRLSLADCWTGMARAVQSGWLHHPKPDCPWMWGDIDMDQYVHYDDPLNGDLHEVVPGKLVAFKGPHELGDLGYRDDENGFRSFSASYYSEVLLDMGVSMVVRLNEPEYDATALEKEKIEVLDLFFEDCTSPPPRVAAAFLAAVDRADGLVAVHCKAGLGRTGTLIALYLMRRHGFSAREAMGWLRIMRPGSVIGEQQHFLCAIEAAVNRPGPACGWSRLIAAGECDKGEGTWSALTGAVDGAPAGDSDASNAAAAAAAQLALDVAAGMERRGSFRARLSCGRSP
jgi:cell division cycle 14